MKRRELLKFIGISPLLPYMASMPKAHANVAKTTPVAKTKSSFFSDTSVARLWEYPYFYVKGHVDGDTHGPNDALRQLAQAELERLVPKKFRHLVKWMEIPARNTDKSDPMNNGGYYGWAVDMGGPADKIRHAQHDYPRDWDDGFKVIIIDYYYFREDTQYARVWELPYDKRRELYEYPEELDEASKQLAHDELERLIPEAYRHRVTFIDVEPFAGDKSDLLGTHGRYGWEYHPVLETRQDKIMYVKGYDRAWTTSDGFHVRPMAT